MILLTSRNPNSLFLIGGLRGYLLKYIYYIPIYFIKLIKEKKNTKIDID